MNGVIESVIEKVNAQIKRNDKTVNDFLTVSPETQCYPFSAPPEGVDVQGRFDKTCQLAFVPQALTALASGKASLLVRSMGNSEKMIGNAFIYVGDIDRQVKARVVFGSSGSVLLGALGILGAANIDARVGHNGVLLVGDKTTINSARFIAVNNNILIGRDGLWSDEILAQGFDQHGIVDIETRQITNQERRDIVTERHVWIGRRTILMPSVTIGEGSIVGTGAIVTKSIPSFSAAAGNPARILRENVSWSRLWTQIDPESALFFDDHLLDLQDGQKSRQ